MYSFVHSKTWNCLEVEKAEALVYIYTNSHLFHQRLGTDPVCYYDDNIFVENSNDDGGAISDTHDDNDDDNSGEGHDGDDGDASDGREEYPKKYLPINLGNVHRENPMIEIRSMEK